MRIALPIVQGIVSYMLANGLPVANSLQQKGYQIADLTNDEVMVDATISLWTEAISQSGDELLPYRVGTELAIEQLGTLGFVLRNSATLGEALGMLNQFNELTNDFVAFSITVRESEVVLGFTIGHSKSLPPKFVQIYSLFEFGYLQGGLSKLTGMTLQPISAETILSDQVNLQLAKLLKCQVMTNDVLANQLVLKSSDLALPVVLPDQTKLLSYIRQAEDELALLAGQKKTTEAVKVVLLSAHGRILSLVEVAAILNLSTRVLQRRLNEEGTSFKQIQELVLKEQAIRLLKLNHTVNEVADRLGYALPSGFIRAFKSWTGQAPSIYKSS